MDYESENNHNFELLFHYAGDEKTETRIKKKGEKT